MIREIRNDDFKYIFELNSKIFDTDDVDSFKIMIENKNYINLLLEEDGIIKAYLFSLVIDKDCAELISICVSETNRRKGLALMIINNLIDRLKKLNFNSIMLEVRESNFSAINLYKKIGFVPISTRKKYYDYKEDAIIMKLQFN